MFDIVNLIPEQAALYQTPASPRSRVKSEPRLAASRASPHQTTALDHTQEDFLHKYFYVCALEDAALLSGLYHLAFRNGILIARAAYSRKPVMACW